MSRGFVWRAVPLPPRHLRASSACIASDEAQALAGGSEKSRLGELSGQAASMLRRGGGKWPGLVCAPRPRPFRWRLEKRVFLFGPQRKNGVPVGFPDITKSGLPISRMFLVEQSRASLASVRGCAENHLSAYTHHPFDASTWREREQVSGGGSFHTE